MAPDHCRGGLAADAADSADVAEVANTFVHRLTD
jgi:hypothetical protein